MFGCAVCLLVIKLLSEESKEKQTDVEIKFIVQVNEVKYNKQQVLSILFSLFSSEQMNN